MHSTVIYSQKKSYQNDSWALRTPRITLQKATVRSVQPMINIYYIMNTNVHTFYYPSDKIIVKYGETLHEVCGA